MNKLTMSVGALCLAVVTAGAAQGQNPRPAPGAGGGQDSGTMPMRWQGPGRPGMNPQRREQLLAQIQERFAERVQTRLGLTSQQMDRLRTEMRTNRDAHQRLQGQEQDLRRAIGDQLRPGIAANQDSLSHLLDALAANHVARAQLEQQELKDLSFLTPVQKAQLLLMRQMLLQRVETIREGRMSGTARGGLGGRQGPPANQGPGPE
jgi:hypothetical protein